MKDMISILKEESLAEDIYDVEQVHENRLLITLKNTADVKKIVSKVTEIDSVFWSLREPILMDYIYEDGRLPILV